MARLAEELINKNRSKKLRKFGSMENANRFLRLLQFIIPIID